MVERLMRDPNATDDEAAVALATLRGDGTLSLSTSTTFRETLFVNSYSLRSFVAIDVEPFVSSTVTPKLSVPVTKSTRAVTLQPTNQECTAASKGEWECPRCTLVNTAESLVQCAACDTRNPSAYACRCCGVVLHPLQFQQGKATLRCATADVVNTTPQTSTPSFSSSTVSTERSRITKVGAPPPPPPPLLDNSTSVSNRTAQSFVNKGLFPLCSSISNALRADGDHTKMAQTAPRTTPLVPLRHQLWVCSCCTLVNVRATKCCEMCGTLRQVSCGKCTFINTLPELNAPTAAVVVAPTIVCEVCSSSVTVPDVDERLLVCRATPTVAGSTDLGVSMTPSMIREVERCDEIVRNEKRLRDRVEHRLGAHIRPQAGDGNCLFRSIADELFDDPQLHQVVRHLICSYMSSAATARESYGMYFETPDAYDGYLQRLAQDGTWGDELCIHAASHVFHVTITVISSTESYWVQSFQAPMTESGGGDTGLEPHSHPSHRIFLAYTNPVHFDSIRLDGSGQEEEGSDHRGTMIGQLLNSLNEALTEERQWTDAGHDHSKILDEADCKATCDEWHVVRAEDH